MKIISESFAGVVLSYLCDNGFQVIVLTHNDDFARDVNYSHCDRERSHLNGDSAYEQKGESAFTKDTGVCRGS